MTQALYWCILCGCALCPGDLCYRMEEGRICPQCLEAYARQAFRTELEVVE